MKIQIDKDGYAWAILTPEENLNQVLLETLHGCPCDDHWAMRADDWYEAMSAVLSERAPA